MKYKKCVISSLGSEAEWVKSCIEQQIIRIGFETYDLFDLCSQCDWAAFEQQFIDWKSTRGEARRKTNQVKAFFEDDGKTLWITFHARCLWWAVIDAGIPPARSPDKQGTFRKVLNWSRSNVNGHPLNMNELSGHLTKLAAFRGASCSFQDLDYVIRKLNAEQSPEVEEAENLRAKLGATMVKMLQQLDFKDFELLVDLVFSSSGWRRTSILGRTQKTMDMELLLPTTNERAFVQVKSVGYQSEFNEYKSVLADMNADEQEIRMFYVYHSGSIKDEAENITLIDGEAFSGMVLDAGLLSWLMLRVGG